MKLKERNHRKNRKKIGNQFLNHKDNRKEES